MTERAELMRIYRSNGISSISLMRDHYNKHDNGGDIQPSDATFRATLTNPVNSYRSKWKNLTKKQKDSLTFGKSTYQDYIDLFNRQMERAFKEKTE